MDTAIPSLRFGAIEQHAAFHEWGANCGPGALAGTCGMTPLDTLRAMPEFKTFGHTREWMLESALNRLGVTWTHARPKEMTYGIARVLWGGPWSLSPNRFQPLAHSHWVGIATLPDGGRMVFDINAIGVGGWISQTEWQEALIPHLMEKEKPVWDGTWLWGEGYDFTPIRYDETRELKAVVSASMRELDIQEGEHPYLHSHPEVCGGRVVIRHSRLSSTAIAGRLAGGETLSDLMSDYPDLSPEMLSAAASHGYRTLLSKPVT